MLRFAADTGGTFTDLVVEGDPSGTRFYKRPTTPDDPVRGLLDVVRTAAQDFDRAPADLLAQGDLFIFGTTRATNAIVERATARTALLVTRGHPDILVLREGGGRTTLFDYTQEYPDPYIPRSLTFEVPERIGAEGEVVEPLDAEAVGRIADELRERAVDAVAVCLLWSIVNPEHERRVGELLNEHLPGVPYTLSHRLNPAVREYRRASSAAIDASLKPLMSGFFSELGERLLVEGFGGRLLIMTSAGGVLDAEVVRDTPIHSIGSGPAAAPVAGRHFAAVDTDAGTAIVTDAGGTTYDVSLIRNGDIPWTRQTTVGHPTYGYITGFPSVDVKSVGAGGGSIAWVDQQGLLHVGPQSAGADPGPACYGRGGTKPTVTDAAVEVGFIDPEYFLGGEMPVDPELSRQAIDAEVAGPLGLDRQQAAAAILHLACERMVNTIEEITLNQGIDPSAAVMVGGGGGAGLYAVPIARRLGSHRVVIPEVAAALSASGALLSDLQADYAVTEVMSTSSFDVDRANKVLDELRASCEEFNRGPGAGAVGSEVRLTVEARYPHQVWEIEVPLAVESFSEPESIERLLADFHRVHEQLFAFSDPGSPIEVVAWRARVRCDLGEAETARAGRRAQGSEEATVRRCYFEETGEVDTDVHRFEMLSPGRLVEGPAIVESPVSAVVIQPGASVRRTSSGSLVIDPGGGGR